jgi:hypothetical protein
MATPHERTTTTDDARTIYGSPVPAVEYEAPRIESVVSADRLDREVLKRRWPALWWSPTSERLTPMTPDPDSQADATAASSEPRSSYDAPRIEAVITSDDLDREMLYAGVPSAGPGE